MVEAERTVIWGYTGDVGLPWWLRWKNLPAARKTRVQSLGQEDALEEGMATHSRTLAWRISWTEEPGKL